MKKAKPITNEILRNVLGIMHYQDKLITRVSVETGLRTSDVLRLRGDSITPEKPSRDNKSYIIATEQKTHKKKVSEISYNLHEDLFLWRQRKKSAPIFTWRAGRYQNSDKAIERTTYYKRLKRISKITRTDMSPHSLRKLYAQNLYARTHDIFAVQKAMNHKYITTTAGYLGIDINALIMNALPK